MANEIKVLKSNTLEDWRQKTNEVSFDLGDNSQLDTTRLSDKVYTYTATTANGGKFLGNDNNSDSLVFSVLPDVSLDNTGGYIILKNGTSIPASFSAGDTLTQSGGFSCTLEAISTVDSKPKLLVKNTSGTFNAGEDLTDSTGTIAHANIIRQISESYSVGSIRVLKNSAELVQDLSTNGYHVLPLAGEVTLTGSPSVVNFHEGDTVYQGSSLSAATWTGTLYHATSTKLLFKTVNGSFSASVQLKNTSTSDTIAGTSHGDITNYTVNGFGIELNTPAANTDTVTVVATDLVDAINELQDDIGTVENLQNNYSTKEVVTALNKLDTDLFGTANNVSFDGLSADGFQDAIEELRDELGDHNLIDDAAGYSATDAVSGITELQSHIGTKANLTTTANTNLVLAINEIDAVFDSSNNRIITSSDFLIDSAGDISIDADGGDIRLKDGGTEVGTITLSANNFIMRSRVQDQDIIFKGNDGGSTVTALTLDMSEAGAAIFNDSITAVGTSSFLNVTTSGTLTVSGLANLNGGIAVDTNKFTVADATGNTSIAGTLGVTGTTTLGTLNAGSTSVSSLGVSGNATVSGTLGVTGLSSLDGGIAVSDGASGDNFTVAATSGNTVIKGTLGVESAVGIDGDFDINTNKFTVDSATGNTVVAGTLNVGSLDTAEQTVRLAINELHTQLGSNLYTGNVGSLLDGSASVTVALKLLEAEIGDHTAYESGSGGITFGANTISGVLVNLNNELDALNALTLTAGDGLSGGGTLAANRSFAVNVDDSSIEINSDSLRVKASGITNAMLAGSINQSKLAGNISNGKLANSTITIGAETGTPHAIALGETLTVSAGAGIDTNINNNTLQISGELATETNAGIATFDGTDFTVTSGDVTINDERIEDIIGAMVSSNTEDGISVTYADADGGAGKLNFDIDDASVLRLAGAQTVTGNKTFTGNVDLSGATVTFGSGGSVQNFNTQFLTLNADTNISGLRIDRSANTSATVSTTVDPDFFWDETQVGTGGSNASHRAWRLKGFSNASTPIANTADVVTFYNAKDLVSASNSSGITPTFTMDTGTAGEHQGVWDFDVNVDDSSIEISSDNLQVKAGGITNAMLAGSIAASKLAGNIGNSKLSNSSITIGNSTIALGGTDTTLTGLTDIDLTSGNKTIFDGVGANTLTLGATTTTVKIAGNFIVDGTTTTLNTATLDVEDKNITLNSGGTTASADGAGITVEEAVDATTNATILWTGSSDRWTFSHDIVAPNFRGNGQHLTNLDATALTGTISDDRLPATITSNITGNVTGNVTGNADTATQVYVTENNSENANLRVLFHDGTNSGNSGIEHDDSFKYNPSTNTITGVSLSGNASTATTLSSNRTFALTGDVTGTVTNNLSSGFSITTDIEANTVGITELDITDGTAGQVLQTDGNGTLSFGSVSTTNNYVSSASFNNTNGVLTLNRQGLSAVTVDLDGRYVTTDNSQATVFQVENDSSTDQFSVGHGDGLEFAASGATSVAFNASEKKVTFSSTDTNTTYLLKAQQTDGNNTDPNLFLDASSGTDDTIKLVGSGATTVTRNSDGQITFNTPAPGNGTLTLSTSAGLDGSASFSANQSGDSTFTVALDLSELTDMTAANVAADELILLDVSQTNGPNRQRRKAISEIKLSTFDNDANFTSNVGDITQVNITAGVGLVGTVNTTSGNHIQTLKANLIDETLRSVTANSITTTASRTYAVMPDADGDLVVNVPWSNTTYSQATSSTLGLVKIGYSENGKNYPVELSNGQMFVNVPWTDTDTNTTDWRVQNNSGTQQFAVTAAEGVRFAGSGATSVSFESSPQRITISSTDTNDIDYINSATFNTGTGVLTLSGVGNAGATVDLDGRFLQSVALGTNHNTSTVEITNDAGANATINAATTSLAGVLTSADKTKLDGIATGAEVNQFAFSSIEFGTYSNGGAGGTPITAASKTDSMDVFFWYPSFVVTPNNTSKSTTIKLNSDQTDQITKMGRSGSGNVFLDMSATGYASFESSSTEVVRITGTGVIHADNDIIAYSTTTTSDEKLKENIQVVDGALEKVSRLEGVTFDWKDKSKGSSAGVIAQNVEEVLPTAVSEVEALDGSGEHKVVNYNQLSALFIEAIKELKEENKLLRDEIENLKSINS